MRLHDVVRYAARLGPWMLLAFAVSCGLQEGDGGDSSGVSSGRCDYQEVSGDQIFRYCSYYPQLTDQQLDTVLTTCRQGFSGTWKNEEFCPEENRVGTCAVPADGENVATSISYYPDLTASSAEETCMQKEGATWSPSSG